MSMSHHRRRRGLAIVGAFAAATLVLGACGNSSDGDGANSTVGKSNTDNDKSGKKVVIGFSAPAADHGWMGAITKNAVAQAKKYKDVTLKVAEGTNDVNL